MKQLNTTKHVSSIFDYFTVQMKEKILFIVNPISGNKKRNYKAYIQSFFQEEDVSFTIVETEYRRHAFELARKHMLEYQYIIAVGGDGTVNEVSEALVNSSNCMGILPCGSGNGLARSLGIPMNTEKALEVIKGANSIQMDTCQLNDKHFVNVSGIGFDARVAHYFDQMNGRGLRNYIRVVLKEFFQSKNNKCKLYYENTSKDCSYFLISFANGNQWGNNIFINPLGHLQDGKIELCIVKKIPFYNLPIFFYYLLTKKLFKSKYVEFISTNYARLEIEANEFMHVDGEPISHNNNLTIRVLYKSINIFI